MEYRVDQYSVGEAQKLDVGRKLVSCNTIQTKRCDQVLLDFAYGSGVSGYIFREKKFRRLVCKRRSSDVRLHKGIQRGDSQSPE